jgi:hypothetical protein
LETKKKVENCNLETVVEESSDTSNPNRIVRPAEHSVENNVEANNDRFLDPDYPSREILLAVADKLLQKFEKR